MMPIAMNSTSTNRNTTRSSTLVFVFADKTPAAANHMKQQIHERAAEHAIHKRRRVPREIREDLEQELHSCHNRYASARPPISKPVLSSI